MPSAFLKNYLTELSRILDTVSADEFESFIEMLTNAYEREANIFIFGNGGSAASAAHFACDINKGYSYGKDRRFKVICLNDNIPTILAYANDMSYDIVFVEQLKNFMEKDDLVIGVSGSGNSVNVLNAIEYANKNGAKTFGISGYGGGRLKQISNKHLVIDSNDMQKIEDLHLIIMHCTMQWFCSHI